MKEFYTPETFDSEKYKKTGWRINLVNLTQDDNRIRIIVNVATGRKYWPIFSVLPNFENGINDPILKDIKFSLNLYTHPMVNRFIEELNIALSDIYQVDIDLHTINSDKKIDGYYSSRKF